jgi:hypothetical protein
MTDDFPSAVPEIPVNDVDRAATYYTEHLGFISSSSSTTRRFSLPRPRTHAAQNRPFEFPIRTFRQNE